MISPLLNFSSQQRRVGAQHLLPTPSSISWSAPGFQKLRELSTPDATDATGSTTEGRLQLSSVGRGTGRSAGHSAAPAASRPRAGGSSSGRGSGCVKWLQERLGQARASAAGGTEAMAEPGPHPSSQPNTPRPVARSLWLSLFFINFPALAITAYWDRISSPRLPSSAPSVEALPTSREVTPAPGHRESLAPADPPRPRHLGHLERAASQSDRRPAESGTAAASGEELPQPAKVQACPRRHAEPPPTLAFSERPDAGDGGAEGVYKKKKQ